MHGADGLIIPEVPHLRLVLHTRKRGTVAIIDYLQILGQQRSKPVLADQMLALRTFPAGRVSRQTQPWDNRA